VIAMERENWVSSSAGQVLAEDLPLHCSMSTREPGGEPGSRGREAAERSELALEAGSPPGYAPAAGVSEASGALGCELVGVRRSTEALREGRSGWNRGAWAAEAPMIPMLKRFEVQVLLRAGHTQEEVVEFTGVSERSVRRIASEEPVSEVVDGAREGAPGVGRPGKAAAFEALVRDELEREPGLKSLELLRRAKLKGYSGRKSAFYEMVRRVRPSQSKLLMRFEGLPAEFSQHDFGEVDVEFLDGRKKRIHFFASRLKWSRMVAVTIVGNQQAETLIRTLAEHFESFGGVPLCAVFDRPKTVALKWKRNGEVVEWNPIFACAALEIGFTAEVCWPYQARQKGSVENLVGWVKGSFFKQRKFHDEQDLRGQLAEWQHEVNELTPSRATGIIPRLRWEADERERLRPARVRPENLALRIPSHVGPTGEVIHDTHSYSMPPESAGFPATIYLYRDRLRIEAGRYESVHDRQRGYRQVSRLPEHRASHLAAISGKRGKRYLKRQHVFETGEAAVRFLTEITHRKPRSWSEDVDRLHDLLQQCGPAALDRALELAVAQDEFSVDFVARLLRVEHPKRKGVL
jgi:transposase